MTAWDVLINRDDLRRVELRHAAEKIDLAEGEVLLEVERFALTANNITYGAMGDSFGYWKFFPAPEGLGRIPVWGFARVVDSKAPDAPVGLRIFGYLPMSSHFTARLSKGRNGLVDTAAHRAELPPTYNAYAEAPDQQMVQLSGPGRYAWRVLTVSRAARRYSASPWRQFAIGGAPS